MDRTSPWRLNSSGKRPLFQPACLAEITGTPVPSVGGILAEGTLSESRTSVSTPPAASRIVLTESGTDLDIRFRVGSVAHEQPARHDHQLPRRTLIGLCSGGHRPLD